MNLKRLREILARAAGKRIAVAGDLMLDEFVWGKVGRISPEAPVPVVEVTGETFYPGGAANVARNLRELIDGVSVIGTVGTDDSGRRLLDLLRAHKIETDLVLEDPDLGDAFVQAVIDGDHLLELSRGLQHDPGPLD